MLARLFMRDGSTRLVERDRDVYRLADPADAVAFYEAKDPPAAIAIHSYVGRRLRIGTADIFVYVPEEIAGRDVGAWLADFIMLGNGRWKP